MPLIFLFVFCLFPLESMAADLGAWDDLVLYIRQQQQAFHRELASAIRAIQDGGLAAAWGLVGVSFMYGIFHAAGPGHGKAIIATYVATHESRLKRAIALSFASAFVQGISAVVLVEGFVGLVGWSRRDAQGMTSQLEQVSFLLVALIGLVLCYRVIKGIWALRNAHSHHDHNHEHDHGHQHHHHDEGEACSVCGHSHAPDPKLLDPKTSLKDTLAIVFSVGIRPCSGSVLVLIFAEIIGLRWAGVGSVFAISLGTAITVSALAFVAVYFRKAALMWAERSGNTYVQHIFLGAALCGGIAITALGLSLFWQTYSVQHPLF